MYRKIMVRVLALSLAMIGAAEAGQITDLQLYDGGASPTVTISYTNPDGTGSHSASVYADPQVSSGTTAPLYYCIDLWHDNHIGATYTINPVSSLSYASSTFSDVDNRIGWLLTQDQSTTDARAAVQLAMWYTIDNVHNSSLAGFSYTGGDSTMTNDYNSLISFAGYNANLIYSPAFWKATHDVGNTLYQDLVSDPVTITPASVPEPGSMVLSAIAFLSIAAVHLRRRAS